VLETVLTRGLTWLPETHTHDPLLKLFAPFVGPDENPLDPDSISSPLPQVDEYFNSEIQCEHGNLDPSKLAAMKFINTVRLPQNKILLS
jgi:hypothetical protein